MFSDAIRYAGGVIGGATVSDWQAQALCRGNHSDLFFPPGSFEKKDERERRETRAKAICQVCPSKSECITYAMKIREPYGIWGGTTETDRKAMPVG